MKTPACRLVIDAGAIERALEHRPLRVADQASSERRAFAGLVRHATDLHRQPWDDVLEPQGQGLEIELIRARVFSRDIEDRARAERPGPDGVTRKPDHLRVLQ